VQPSHMNIMDILPSPISLYFYRLQLELRILKTTYNSKHSISFIQTRTFFTVSNSQLKSILLIKIIPKPQSHHDALYPIDDIRKSQGATAAAETALIMKMKRPTACVLHSLPLEIRDMVFKECLVMDKKQPRATRATPALLIALRGDWALYQEALKWFYALNRFTLTKHNFNTSFSTLSTTSIALMKNLSVELE
jgi:hypothetical protein